MTKSCGKCKEVKTLNKFNKSKLSGFQSYCKDCHNKEQKIYRKNFNSKPKPLASEGHKHCTACKQEKPLDDFYSRDKKYCKDGKYSSCKICHDKRTRKYKDIDLDRTRNTYLKYTFGITLEEYNIKFKEQNGLCAICKEPETSKQNKKENQNKQLAVDHCHKTGKVRGLLCTRCNTSLGGFKDKIDNLISATEYLKKYDR